MSLALSICALFTSLIQKMKEAKFLKCTFLSALFALFHLKQSYKCIFNIEALNLTWLLILHVQRKLSFI